MTTFSIDQIGRFVWDSWERFCGPLNRVALRNHCLTVLFWKFLSDLWGDRQEQYRHQFGEDVERIERRMRRERFRLPSGAGFESLWAQRGAINLGERINHALCRIENENKDKLAGLWEQIDFNSDTALGPVTERNARLRRLLEDLNQDECDLRPSVLGDEQRVGEISEYLLGRFAALPGQGRRDDFYTPPPVSQLLATLLCPKGGSTIFDPACGTGSLLREVGKAADPIDVALFGQELNPVNLATGRLNLLLHGMDMSRLEWGDSLTHPRLLEDDGLMQFDVVVAQPPFSLEHWGRDQVVDDRYHRFRQGIPPRSKGDFAFLLHALRSTKSPGGKVGLLLPLGVLYRGGAEGGIRRRLVEENLLEVVVGLPPKLLYGTSVGAALLILHRGREDRSVMFVDGTSLCSSGRGASRFSTEVIEQIGTACRGQLTQDGFSRCVLPETIAENEFILSLNRYIRPQREEPAADAQALEVEIQSLEGQLTEIRSKMEGYLMELGV